MRIASAIRCMACPPLALLYAVKNEPRMTGLKAAHRIRRCELRCQSAPGPKWLKTNGSLAPPRWSGCCDEEPRRMITMRWPVVFALAAGIAASACGSGTGPSGSGTLRMTLKDSPFSDAKALLVTFTDVSVHQSDAADGSWTKITTG